MTTTPTPPRPPVHTACAPPPTHPQRRIESFATHPDQWLLPEDTWKSYDRFRIMFNYKQEDADPLCAKLRASETEVKGWIRR